MQDVTILPSNTWFTSDQHLGEDRLKLIGRPFDTSEEMIEALIENHNKLVKPTDTVHFVGDICYKNAPEYLKYVHRFNGVKILYRGNHDVVFTDEQLAPYFDEIVPEGHGRYLMIDDLRVYVTHYPTRGQRDAFNLVGHIHSAWKYQLNMFNVGVDVNHFMPVNMDEVPHALTAITDFYDEDVWVAYQSINQHFRNDRGKKSVYFNG